MTDIVKLVGQEIAGSENILAEKSKKHPIPEVKWAIWFVLYLKHGYSYQRIADMFNGYTHQGIQYGIARTREMIMKGDRLQQNRIAVIEAGTKKYL